MRAIALYLAAAAWFGLVSSGALAAEPAATAAAVDSAKTATESATATPAATAKKVKSAAEVSALSAPAKGISLEVVALPADGGLKSGQLLKLDGRQATVARAEALPYVENYFSRVYTYDKYDNPKLAELRGTYKLDQVVAGGKTEFEKQVMLMSWANAQFKFGTPPKGQDGLCNALEIMKLAAEGNKMFCVHYAALLMSSANSLGWVSREMAIPQHTFTEIWSNQFGKWVMLDPTSTVYAEKGGRPLNSFEIRQEWFLNQGSDMVFVVNKFGQPAKRVPAAGSAKSPLSVARYYVLGYIPNTNLMDERPDWGKMFVTKDEVSDKHPGWHTRKNPQEPATEPYFPINQATLTVTPAGKDLKVDLKTLTPNFKEFQVKIDGGEWQGSPATLVWKLHAGKNVLQARSTNLFDVAGPVSTVELEVKE